MAINKNDYLDGDGNYDLKKELVDEVIDEVNTLTKRVPAWSDITGKPAQATRWPSWGEVTGKSAQTPSESVEIPPNSNMNSYTTPGFYHSASRADMKTVENHPSGDAGSLMVLKNAGVTQFWVNFWTDDTKMYVRNQYGGIWGAWRQF